MLRTTLLALGFTALASAHVAAFAPGMYCRGGPDPSVDNQNTNTVVNPLYQLAKEDWWFQHDRGCDKVPPKAGEFLELPANGQVTVELAHNRAQTTLSYNGQYTSQWPDGKDHPEDWNGWNTDGTVSVCLKDDGAMHTYNESSAGATAFAISYNNNLEAVTMENLVVFTTLDHTPWKRIATYDVPDLPACPEGGCTCAWVWIPNGCGTANMYMQGFKCNVTGASPTAKPLGKAQVPVYCEGEPDKCVKGPKQMLAWHQATGNNIVTADWVTPNYNQKCGWAQGAQKDIFDNAATPSSPASSSAAPSSTSAVVASSSSTSTVVPTYAQPLSTVVYPTTLATRTSSNVIAASSVVKDAAPTSVVPVAGAITTVTSVSTAYVTKVSTSVSVSTAYVTLPVAACTIRKPRHSHN